MKSLMLGACLSAVLGAPALAQPGDKAGGDRPDPYYDQAPPPQPQPPQPPASQGGYQDDRGYDQQDRGRYQPPPQPPPAYAPDQRAYDPTGQGGYRAYRVRPGLRRYGDVPAVAHYTRRVGASWRNDEGQFCAWRELAWLDANGVPAYRWVPRCD